MTAEAEEPDETPERAREDVSRWETWSLLSIILALLMLVAWGVVVARPGILGVQIHAMVIPTLGVLTLPLLAWGLIRTLFRPPALRRSRTIAFFVLLGIGYAGNVPTFAPPLATSDWTSKHRYLLPFDGEWIVLAGGPDRDRNYHATTAAIRWAYDFAPVRDGARFALDGEELKDWYCVGEPVYAPVAGKVVQAVDDVIDNTPGEVSGDSVFGNHVIIEAGPEEYVFVAHMERHSLAVEAGDHVTTNTVIGACGNSGRTVEPHVHVHAQDRADFPIAQGLPLRFVDYEADGEVIDNGMPVGGSEWSALDGQEVENVGDR